MGKPYILGIDLGTSNSALSLASCKAKEPSVKTLAIHQQLSEQSVGGENTLPSAVYLPAAAETGLIKTMPWENVARDLTVGGYARGQIAKVPNRVVASAKSWLCQKHVDREAAILPWDASGVARAEQRKMSPIEAARQVLSQIKASFEYEYQGRISRHEYSVVLTVPASFDEVARNLTLRAAKEAGFHDVALLEEPQAALYAWLYVHKDSWREELAAGDVVLVCDLGGGTADFSLVAVVEEEGALRLERISVGDHILLGGDNMDLALACLVRAKLEAQGKGLDYYQMLSLVHQARVAKERLFSEPELKELPLAISSMSANLFASSITATLTREELLSTVREGFFPLVGADERADEKRQIGLKELGLPYAQDAAITRHLASFLAASKARVDLGAAEDSSLRRLSTCGQMIKPSKVLFNGGVCYAAEIKKRVLEQIQCWTNEDVAELANVDYDLAVSLGAAYFGLVSSTGEGLRIKAGAAGSFYIGVESSGLAVPGIKPELKALCLVPQGAEEGSEFELTTREFGLVVGESVKFRCFVSNDRGADKFSDLVNTAQSSLQEIATLETVITLAGAKDGEIIPVVIRSVFNTVGVLEIWLVHKPTQTEWKLEFNVRV